MTKSFICTIAAASVAVFAFAAAPTIAHAKTAKACEADWKAGKADIQKAGTKKKDFMSTCRASDASASAPAPASVPTPTRPAPAAKPSASDAGGGQPGRVAMIARERACGADWKTAKAAGQTGDQKWPQYWSDCNKRKKAQGM